MSVQHVSKLFLIFVFVVFKNFVDLDVVVNRYCNTKTTYNKYHENTMKLHEPQKAAYDPGADRPRHEERLRISSNFIQEVDRLVKSNWFWAYCQMICLVSSFLSQLSSWAEGCYCHEDQLVECPSWHYRKRHPCQFKGRRAPELAFGVLDTKIDLMVAASLSEILSASRSLTEDEQATLLLDFNQAVDKTVFEVQLKTGHWQMLPWKLCIVAHVDEEVARAGVRSCLDLWNSTRLSQRHHRMTRRFFDPSYTGNSQDDHDVSLANEAGGGIQDSKVRGL